MTLSVLHVAQPLDAGVPRVAAALVADQVERGWDISVAAPAGGDLRRAAEAAGARWLPWEASRQPGPSTPAEALRLGRIVRDVSPGLIHLHSAKAGVAGRIAVRGRLPTVFQPHAWSFEAAGGVVGRGATVWERASARWAHAIVCVSADEQRRGEDAGVAGAFEVVPNGVDLERWSHASDDDRAAARAALGVGPDVPLAVSVGRLARQKGVDVLLAGWSEVLRRVPDAELALVGDGPDRAELEAIGAPRVRFLGDGQDVSAWLAAATATVIPSRWEAGLTLVAMEAMARGRTVVATAVAGMHDGIGPDAGAVVPVEDVDALAAALGDRLADRERADAEGRAGRRRVEERFDIRVACDRMAAVYEAVLARRGAASPTGASGGRV